MKILSYSVWSIKSIYFLIKSVNTKVVVHSRKNDTVKYHLPKSSRLLVFSCSLVHPDLE